MASETELTELSSLFLPFILGLTPEQQQQQQQPEPEDRREEPPSGERVILINPFTQGMVVIEGALNFAGKSDRPPASKASIEAMPVVEVREGEEDGECVICLENWVCGDSLKEMPCKHKFHGGCIDKWLEIHGSCPVCRFEMPVEERRRRGRTRREVWVSFAINTDVRRNMDSD